jgi:ribonuclease HII
MAYKKRSTARRKAAPHYVIGIDEVGRGALAGPVVVAAVLAPSRRDGWLGGAVRKELGTIRDSKKLTPAAREAWSVYLTHAAGIGVALARVYPRGIDRMNISRAANRAAMRAFMSICLQYGIDPARMDAVLDGGLFLESRAVQERRFPHARTRVKADETVPAVAAASIVAKITRDRFMERLARRWPSYGFEIHKGYGTAAHRAALARTGPCTAHRLTFLGRTPIVESKKKSFNSLYNL